MKKYIFSTFLFSGIFWFHALQVNAQNSQVFRMAEGFVRIAEPGQLADTVSVWGDISSPGRYIIPRGTTPNELISYARGPITRNLSNEVALDWSKRRLELNISTYHPETRTETVENFIINYSEAIPVELRDYKLKNGQIISLELKRKPGLPDYLRVLAPILSVTTTAILLIDRLSN